MREGPRNAAGNAFAVMEAAAIKGRHACLRGACEEEAVGEGFCAFFLQTIIEEDLGTDAGFRTSVRFHVYRYGDQIFRQGTNARLRDTQEVPF